MNYLNIDPSLTKLDINKFERLLCNNDQGYKFFWLEAILKLIAQNKKSFTFEEVVDEMIEAAWYMVVDKKFSIGHKVEGKSANALEQAIRTLYECSQKDIGENKPFKEQLMFLIKKYNDNIMEYKLRLIDCVPYRLIKPFVEKEGKEYIDRKKHVLFIRYLNKYTRENSDYFYNIIDAAMPLKRKICLNDQWIEFILNNYNEIMNWLILSKKEFIEKRNVNILMSI